MILIVNIFKQILICILNIGVIFNLKNDFIRKKINFIFILFFISITYGTIAQNQINKIKIINKNTQEAVSYIIYGNNFGDTIYWGLLYSEDTNCIKLSIPENSVWTIGYSLNKLILDTLKCGKTLFTDTNRYYSENINSCFELYAKKPVWATNVCLNQIGFDIGFRFDTDSLFDGFSWYVEYNGGSWVNMCQDNYPDDIFYNSPIYNITDTILSGIPAYSGSNYYYPGCCTLGNFSASKGFSIIECFMHWSNSHAYDIDSLGFKLCFNSDSVNRFHEGVQIDFLGISLTDACNVGVYNNVDETKNSSVNPNPLIFESVVLFPEDIKKISIYDIYGGYILSVNGEYGKAVIKRDWFKGPGVFIIKGISDKNIFSKKLIIN